MAEPKFKRILLKISGEALMGDAGYGIHPEAVATVADEIREIHAMGVCIALVVGGGNIFRGIEAGEKGLDRVTADHMGMLATVINGLALQDALEKKGIPTRLMTAIAMQALAEPYIRRRACATSRRAAWSSSRRARGTPTSRPIRPPRCGPSRSRPSSS